MVFLGIRSEMTKIEYDRLKRLAEVEHQKTMDAIEIVWRLSHDEDHCTLAEDDIREQDDAMKKAVTLFESSGKTLEELGEGMGYDPARARTSAWQFLNKTNDPRISMLRRFAKAMGIDVAELVQ